MSYEHHNDASTLGWVRNELEQTLQQAAHALEEYSEDPSDRTQLRFCATYLHQVYGTLQMLELYGLSMLVEEMEQVLDDVINAEAGQTGEGEETLMQGILSVSGYLDRIQQGERDNGILVLPLLNDLRAARGASLLTEGMLFAPDLERQGEPAGDSDAVQTSIRELAQQHRPEYQRALLAYLRGQSVELSLERMQDILDRLDAASSDASSGNLWWIAAGVVDGLRQGGLEATSAVKSLLGQVDRHLKKVIASSDVVAVDDPPRELLKNLLYYVGQSGAGTERLEEIQRRFALADSLPDEQDMARHGETGGYRPGSDILQSVADALREDVTSVKDALDLYVRSNQSEPERLSGMEDALRRVADTLGMLGLGAARRTIKEQLPLVEQLADGRPADEQELMEFARSLLYVESALDGLTAGGGQADDDAADHGGETSDDAGTVQDSDLFDLEYRAVYHTAIREAVADIGVIKEALVSLMEERGDAPLENLEPVLRRLQGALEMLDLQRAGGLLEAAGRCIREEVIAGGQLPSEERLDALADAITSLEYYLEAVLENRTGRESILDVAENSVRTLGYSTATNADGEPGATATDGEPVDGGAPPEHPETSVETGVASPPAAEEGTVTDAPPRGTRGVDLDIAVSSDGLDDEILEIFLEEVDECLETIREAYPRWRQDPAEMDALVTVRRMFHTLKGSGRLAGALLLGEMAWSVERLLNRVIDGYVAPGPEVFALLDDAIEHIPDLVGELQGGEPTGADVRYLMQRAVELADGTVPAAPNQTDTEVAAASDADEPDHASAGAPSMDAALYQIFRNETTDHLDTVRAFIAACKDSGDGTVTDDLLRALHTLSGSARMADVPSVATLARDLELHAAMRHDEGRSLDEYECQLMMRGVDLLDDSVAALGQGGPLPDTTPLRDELAALAVVGTEPEAADGDDPAAVEGASEEPAAAFAERYAEEDVDQDLVDLFLEEADDILAFLDEALARWEDDPEHERSLAELQRSLHTLKGGARLARFDRIAALCHAVESLVNGMASGRVAGDDAFFTVLRDACDRLAEMALAARDHGDSGDAQDVIDRVESLNSNAGAAESPASSPVEESADRELMDVFLEEAAEILHAIETAQQAWMEAPDDSERVRDLERALHTLKGGARMAGYSPVANLSHGMETLLAQRRDADELPSSALFDLLERSHDRLYQMREQAERGDPLQEADELLAEIESARSGTPSSPPDDDDTGGPETVSPAPAESVDVEPATAARGDEPRSAGGDHVRVRSELLDQLVGHAGEVSIYRARLDQQVGAVRFNLGELNQTVQRLREQLRTLDMETEAQMLHRHEPQPDGRAAMALPDAGAPDQDGFDPLELDRYTRMQELSRSLGESVNDLSSIESLLDHLARESETLLLQQSRINTELQDGLMRTRMVPFASLVPRLRRIVRQTAAELGRKAQIRVQGAQGEMDRTVLDRVVAPLEHMLRNAVAHGIETPEARVAAGKADTGQITLSLDREGADVVLRVSDDGSGMDLDAIRRKALERGLLRDEAELTDRETMQFVMEQGFSTASEVTQVAGRGVGMDVVNAEIKQLGGSLDIDSEPGAGTRFTVRLPFTLAMNQALLCTAADQAYAVPLTSIDGVVRVTRDQMETYLAQGEEAVYHYAGQDYQVTALSLMLGEGEPNLSGHPGRVPVVLLQSGDHRLAMQVDDLIDSREIVVKSVGPQISAVPGIHGATILADGRVVLILEMGALMRQGVAVPEPESEAPVSLGDVGVEAAGERADPLVMVVDDSITMRKVATRLLERHHMQVVTASDGVDAVAKLQDIVPDAMVLDIEMPRMDGYELATHMRNDDRLRAVPIVMVTSRSGEKHRQRALEIGVDRYLSKPYQESDLLGNLHEVLTQDHGGH